MGPPPTLSCSAERMHVPSSTLYSSTAFTKPSLTAGLPTDGQLYTTIGPLKSRPLCNNTEQSNAGGPNQSRYTPTNKGDRDGRKKVTDGRAYSTRVLGTREVHNSYVAVLVKDIIRGTHQDVGTIAHSPPKVSKAPGDKKTHTKHIQNGSCVDTESHSIWQS